MAFGFGFNRQKVLSAAEKFVQQGKLQNAIAEYEKVLKSDPKELTVLNTVGDLHARLGQHEQAVECFKSVGDAYASQGFTVKAIAMYKKLSKLKPSLDSVLRLAELYTQQGLFNDARAQYRQVAEEFLRTGELEQAARIFQKTLEMDPENVAMRTRLAEVYVRLGKKTEAWQIFSEAAETLRSRGAVAPAEELLQRMLTLDPGNSSALLLRGRIAFESADLAGAIQHLEKIADLDSHPDGLRVLMQAYVRTGRFPEAGTLAGKLLSVHNDVDSVIAYTEALIGSGHFEDALHVFQQHAERLLASNPSKVLDTLHTCIGHVRENTAALEILLELLTKSGDNTHIAEVCELLAHSCVQSGDLEQARDYYSKLMQLEPQNQIHARSYQQMVAQLGGSSAALITAEEGASLVEELEAAAPFIDQRYPDDVALAVRGALTDADLFLSYNMPAKALEPLLAVLPKASSDLRLNQRLAALHTRAGRFSEASACCATLASIYHDAGHAEEATRYGELAEKYKERAVVGSASSENASQPEEVGSAPQPALDSPAEMENFGTAEALEEAESVVSAASAVAQPSGLFWHAPVTAWPKTPSEPPVEVAGQSEEVAHVEAPVSAEPSVEVEAVADQEIDLSEEWEGSLSEESEAQHTREATPEPEEATAAELEQTSKAAMDSVADEVRFYLGQFMVNEARVAMAKLEQMQPDVAILAELRAGIEAASAVGRSAGPEPVGAVSIEEEAGEDAAGVAEPHAATEEPASFASTSQSTPLKEFTSDLESSLGEGFPLAPPPSAAGPEPAHPAAYTQAASAPSSGALSEFVTDLEGSLGDSFLAPAPPPEPQAEVKKIQHPTAAASPIETVQPVPAATPMPPAAMAAAASAPAQESAAFTPAFTYQPRPLQPADRAPSAPKLDESLGVDLAGMFGELRQELEADTAVEEDCETHYNLGVAFREMGLLDEAIGEFQKVCQAAEHGKAFPQLMQAYTWLAQCFLDKGVPEAAVRWYEKALRLPGLDAETCTALHYELASSYEAAHNKPAALNHFLEVYGINIDYRDVAERIQTLKS